LNLCSEADTIPLQVQHIVNLVVNATSKKKGDKIKDFERRSFAQFISTEKR